MDYRKLIKFGESSHVISLPTRWIRKNNLKKGDMIYFEENGNNEIIISPSKKEKEKVDKKIVIGVDGKEKKQLVREIVTAYLNNFNIIKFEGNEIARKSETIRNITQNLVALQTIEQTNNYILVKDFLDIDTISADNLIRKIDLIIRVVLLDMVDILDGKESESLQQKEEDINKLAFLAEKGIRYLMINGRNNPMELLSKLHLITALEAFADEVKRLSRRLKDDKIEKNIKSRVKDILVKNNELYFETIKAYYTNNKELVFDLAHRKDGILDLCSKLIKDNRSNVPVISLADKMKVIIGKNKELGRSVCY